MTDARQFYEIRGLTPLVCQEDVLRAMECRKDSPFYEELEKESGELLLEAPSLVKPVGILGHTVLPDALATKDFQGGTPVVYGVLSIGDGLKERSTEAFRSGDCVRGMLWDVVADLVLFSLDEQMLEALRKFCSFHGTGVRRRLEAPGDISMEVQKEAWRFLELEKRYGIRISEGYMFDPVKTSCQIFVLTEEEGCFRAQHDCIVCKNKTCRFRRVV